MLITPLSVLFGKFVTSMYCFPWFSIKLAFLIMCLFIFYCFRHYIRTFGKLFEAQDNIFSQRNDSCLFPLVSVATSNLRLPWSSFTDWDDIQSITGLSLSQGVSFLDSNPKPWAFLYQYPDSFLDGSLSTTFVFLAYR